MNTFNTPLPIPKNAVALTDNERATLQKYLQRIEAAQRQIAIAQESMNDIGMAIAARAGHAAPNFKLSADLGCLIPKE